MPENALNVWFECWFNSPYYHLLYKNRNQNEAQVFIDNLLIKLKPTLNAQFLDLACGKGRHSLYLNSKGFDVTGIDLSPESIAYASKNENEFLHFYVHDMRNLFRTNYYDYILNLFTSFGYFEKESDDIATITAACKGLKTNGTFVMDFFNAEKITANLIPSEEKTIDGILFQLNKKIENNFIIKKIKINDHGKEFNFQERVKILRLPDFEKYFHTCGLKIVDLYGDYDLNPFDKGTSDRLIVICKKTQN